MLFPVFLKNGDQVKVNGKKILPSVSPCTVHDMFIFF